MNILDKVTRSLRKRGIKGVIGAVVADFVDSIERGLSYFRVHHSSYCFTDRGSGSHTLIVVLAGYKAYLWPATLMRIREFAPTEADICLVSAGIWSESLKDICERDNWSYQGDAMLSSRNAMPTISNAPRLQMLPGSLSRLSPRD